MVLMSDISEFESCQLLDDFGLLILFEFQFPHLLSRNDRI